MATPSEIAKLEQAARDAQAALTRARAENASADAKWVAMVAEAERMCAAGKSVSAEFIVGAAAKARASQGIAGKAVEKPKIVPLHLWRGTEHFSFYDPSSKDRK
jgi:hypothetical protein